MKKKNFVLVILLVVMVSSLSIAYGAIGNVAVYGGSMSSIRFSDCIGLEEKNNSHYFFQISYSLEEGVDLIAELDCFYTKTLFSSAYDNVRASLLPPQGSAVCVGFKNTTTWSSWGSGSIATTTAKMSHSRNNLFAGYFGRVLD